MMNVKVLKRGEFLFREGEKAGAFFLVQSGSVQLFLTRQKQQIDICTLGSAQLVGEHVMTGTTTNPHSAVCVKETTVIEIAPEIFRAQLEAASPVMKQVTKSLGEKLKVVSKELQSARLDRDNSPCPPEQTAKVFATIYHSLKTKSRLEGNKATAPWGPLKSYAQRMFTEPPKRFENAVNIFVKLGLASFEKATGADDNENIVDGIANVVFNDLDVVEQICEYYQFHYFKGRIEFLRVDERAMRLVGALLLMSSEEKPDFRGSVKVDSGKLTEVAKNEGWVFNSDLLSLLETKGLFVKRQSDARGVSMLFERAEFERIHRVWKVLREIERWNVKGSVDPNEALPEAAVAKAAATGVECPDCHHVFETQPKFCAECGHRFVNAA